VEGGFVAYWHNQTQPIPLFQSEPFREFNIVAVMQEQTNSPDLQDQELTSLK
jgi:hypothetical protein